MSKKLYTGGSLETCIKNACDDLKLLENELKYTIIEEKKSFFKKKVVIEVEIEESDTDKNPEFIEHAEAVKGIDAADNSKNFSEINGSVKIEQGKIIVKDPKENGKAAIIYPSINTKLVINDAAVNSKTEIFENNKIEVILGESAEASRQLNIDTSSDNLKAYLTIKYFPKVIYKLKDVPESNFAALEVEEESLEYPPLYTSGEIKAQLQANGITYGILEDSLSLCTNKEGVNKLLIANGTPVINDEDDDLEIMFNISEKAKFSEDHTGTVDFKSIGFVNSVNKGAVLAINHIGAEGTDGKNLAGGSIKHKKGKKIKLKIGEGCEIKDDNIVVAARQGEPSYIGGRFSIYEMHEVKADVDISTGNIKFDGDVAVYGDVKEGMEVDSGNTVKVGRSIENAKIKAKGNVVVQQNVIFSSIFAGGENLEKIQLLELFNNLESNINQLVEAVKQVNSYNLLGSDRSNGEIIKVLLESRFKAIPKICGNILQVDDANIDDIKNLLKEKLIGLSPLSIKYIDELLEISGTINIEVVKLKDTLAVPVDVTVGYSQNSTIQSSGNITISGKGEYVSNIIANGKVNFLNPSSVARGGIIKAKDEIKCGIVGSVAAVATKLMVEKNGHIYAMVAFPNTSFCVGSKEEVLDVLGKSIHVYLDSDGEIIVDKFLV